MRWQLVASLITNPTRSFDDFCRNFRSSTNFHLAVERSLVKVRKASGRGQRHHTLDERDGLLANSGVSKKRKRGSEVEGEN